MSAAPATSAPTSQPDPDRAVAGTCAGAGVPTSVGRLLSLVRKLITYGKELVGTLQQCAAAGASAAPGFAHLTRRFGTADLALIFARITCGLHRAAALEARLNQRAARGQDIDSAPVRLASPQQPQAGQPAVTRVTRAGRVQDPHLDCLPTVEQIAAEMRRRPVGAVIADICHDLGITPGSVGILWREVSFAIMQYGGSLARFYKDMARRLDALWDVQSDREAPAGVAPRAPSPGFASTGPPRTSAA
jgi:hypothetical protein